MEWSNKMLLWQYLVIFEPKSQKIYHKRQLLQLGGSWVRIISWNSSFYLWWPVYKAEHISSKSYDLLLLTERKSSRTISTYIFKKSIERILKELIISQTVGIRSHFKAYFFKCIPRINTSFDRDAIIRQVNKAPSSAGPTKNNFLRESYSICLFAYSKFRFIYFWKLALGPMPRSGLQ